MDQSEPKVGERIVWVDGERAVEEVPRARRFTHRRRKLTPKNGPLRFAGGDPLKHDCLPHRGPILRHVLLGEGAVEVQQPLHRAHPIDVRGHLHH